MLNVNQTHACTMDAYIVMSCIVMAHIVMAHACTMDAYIVMAYIIMAYIVMAHACTMDAYIVMADIVMAYIVMAHACRTDAYIFMAYTGVAYIVVVHACIMDAPERRKRSHQRRGSTAVASSVTVAIVAPSHRSIRKSCTRRDRGFRGTVDRDLLCGSAVSGTPRMSNSMTPRGGSRV